MRCRNEAPKPVRFHPTPDITSRQVSGVLLDDEPDVDGCFVVEDADGVIHNVAPAWILWR
jgi:hypothetical protein